MATGFFSQIAVVGLRARYNGRGDFLITTTPPIGSSSQGERLFFPHIVVGGGYNTQVVLFNSGGVTMNGLLNVKSQAGTNLPIAIGVHP